MIVVLRDSEVTDSGEEKDAAIHQFLYSVSFISCIA